jgi:hypothetical protein
VELALLVLPQNGGILDADQLLALGLLQLAEGVGRALLVLERGDDQLDRYITHGGLLGRFVARPLCEGPARHDARR